MDVCPLKDNFTCISTKGKSVVNYMAITQDNLVSVKDFEVKSMSSMLEELNLQDEADGRPSDHSLLYCEIVMSYPSTVPQATLIAQGTLRPSGEN